MTGICATSSEERSSVRRWVNWPTLWTFAPCMAIGTTTTVTGVISATAVISVTGVMWLIRRRARIVAAELSATIGIRANGSGTTIVVDIVMDRGVTSTDPADV